ncbi:MAG TPA: O-antigen ligase family protein [Methylococcaceae bacterium]|nr:O-antigen ligase family protein [Methylococcaceae bacterium]
MQHLKHAACSWSRGVWSKHGEKIAKAFPAALAVFALSGYGSRFSTPLNMQWFGIATLMAFLMVKAAREMYESRQAPIGYLDVAALLFLGYSAISLSWSEDAGTGIIFLVKAAMLYAIFYVLHHYADSRLLESLRWGVLVSVLVAVGREVAGGPVWSGFHNENFVTEYLLHSFPFVLLIFATGGRGLRWALAALTLWLLHYFIVRNGSKIEFAVFSGLIALYVFVRLCSLPSNLAGRGLVGSVLVGLGCLAVYSFWEPFWSSDFGSSFKDRAGMYVAALSMIKSAPLLGVGAGGFRGLYPLYHEDYFQYFNFLSATNLSKLTVTGEAHNDYLEFLASFGLVGLLFVMVSAYLCRRIWKSGMEADAGLLVVGVAALNALVEFPLQNPATSFLFVLGLAHGTSGRAPDRVVRLRARWTPLMPAVLALVLLTLTAVGAYRYYWFEVYDRLSRHYFGADGRTAFLYMEMAHRYNPWDWMTTVSLYEALVNWRENGYSPSPGRDVVEGVYQAVAHSGAKHVPLVVYGRIQMLLNDGRYVTHSDEIKTLFDSLFRSSKHLADTWILYGYYNALMGNTMLARQSLHKARSFQLTPNQLLSVGGVESLLEAGMHGSDGR